MSGPKETVYDDQIFPLMERIIDICKAHKIAMLADFCLDDDEDGKPLKCTTALLSQEFSPDEAQRTAIRELYGKPSLVAITVTRGKEGGA